MERKFADENEEIEKEEEKPIVFLTAYNDTNLQISRKLGMLGWVQQSSELSAGDYVYVFNTTSDKIETCFQIKSKSDNINTPVWRDEVDSNTLIYRNRWNAEVRSDTLNIDLDEIYSQEPFRNNKKLFSLLTKNPFPRSLGSQQFNEFRSFLLSKTKKEFKGTEQAITLEDVSRQTYFSIDTIKEVEILLHEKKQIIFYGPPGTSKTYFAKIFARYFTRNSDNIALIQFHPSYSYEDFIEGIKPNLSETGQANGFSRQDGFFKKLVNKCNIDPNSKYVLIIDEINRGNIAKIFGELIYLLEYRKEKVVLTYSPNESFSIPSNLYLIGTMNSADRSIAFVDYALRRRFYFKNFYPDSNVNLLREWFEDHPPNQVDSEDVIHMLEEINKVIVERLGREYQIGHSYLMKEDLDNDALRRIIDYAIMPLLEQYFFGKKERLEEFKEICNRTIMPV